jgi:hypothetical protein
MGFRRREFLARLGSEIVNQKIEEERGSSFAGRRHDIRTRLAMPSSFSHSPEHEGTEARRFPPLMSQNPFAKPEKPKSPESKPPKPVVNLEDPAAKTTKLIVTTAVGDERSRLRTAADKRTIVKEGASFSVAGINGTLSSVESHFILVHRWKKRGMELARHCRHAEDRRRTGEGCRLRFKGPTADRRARPGESTQAAETKSAPTA